jgi:hypothetical protein
VSFGLAGVGLVTDGGALGFLGAEAQPTSIAVANTEMANRLGVNSEIDIKLFKLRVYVAANH